MANTTTSPAHTRGPWRTDWLGDDRGWILDGRSNYIADIVTADACGFVVSKTEQRANARLIAAAPELLQACKAALAEYYVPEGNGKIPTLLRKAIAQAEGRNPDVPGIGDECPCCGDFIQEGHVCD